jgi:predicted DsbA family dithiol-disulfide isomerase
MLGLRQRIARLDIPVTTTVDVFSDVVCPWCYLGKRRLSRALAAMPQRLFAIHWLPFQLDPTIPAEGIDRDAYLIGKFGSTDAIEPAHQRLTEMGRAEGIEYRFDRITRSPNTIDAHRLIRWAAPAGVQDALVERLFAAYFTEGRDIGDHAVLAAIAAEAGLGGDIAARLAGDEDTETINAEIQNAYRIGVSGVPCYVIDRRLGVMGAQMPDALVAAVAQADALKADLPPDV